MVGGGRSRVEMLISAHDHLPVRTADLDHVERRSGSHPESLALAHGEVVDSGVLANDFSRRGHEVSGRVRQALALLGEVSINETLVVAAGHEADFLRIWLLSQSETVLASQFPDFGLGHVAEPEQRAA